MLILPPYTIFVMKRLIYMVSVIRWEIKEKKLHVRLNTKLS